MWQFPFLAYLSPARASAPSQGPAGLLHVLKRGQESDSGCQRKCKGHSRSLVSCALHGPTGTARLPFLASEYREEARAWAQELCLDGESGKGNPAGKGWPGSPVSPLLSEPRTSIPGPGRRQPSPQRCVYIQARSSSSEDVAVIALGEDRVWRAAYGNPIVSSSLQPLYNLIAPLRARPF